MIHRLISRTVARSLIEPSARVLDFQLPKMTKVVHFSYSQNPLGLRTPVSEKPVTSIERDFYLNFIVNQSNDLKPTKQEEELLKAKNKIINKKQQDPGMIIIKKKKSLWETFKDLMLHMGKSLKDIYYDFNYIIKLRKENGRLSNFSLIDYIKYRQITYDLFKFLPYSFFIVVPLAEFLLPFYMLMFPNSIPSQFFTEKSIGEFNQKFLRTQQDGLKILENKIQDIIGDDFIVIHALARSLSLNPRDFKTKMRLQMMDEELTQRLVRDWPKHKDKLTLKNLSIKETEAFLKLFFVEYINGRNQINLIYNAPRMLYKYGRKLITGQYPPGMTFTDLSLNFFPFKQI